MSAPSPHATGTLEGTPFGELLVQALDHRLTGTLVLEEAGGARHGIYLEGGRPKNVKLATPRTHLGDVLVATGAISQAVRESTLERALREQVLHGQLLIGEGLIDPETLGRSLSEHLARQIVQLFAQPLDTQFGFFERQNYLAQWGAPLAVEPNALELLWRGVREHAGPREIDGALKRVLGLKLELRRGFPAGHFDFMGEDRALVALLEQGPRRLTELVDATPAREAALKRVLYFLVLTRSVDLGLPSAPPVGLAAEPFEAPRSARLPSFTDEVPPVLAPPRSPSRRDSPPSSIPPAVVHSASLRDELRKRSEHPPRSHYEVLGLPEDAPVRQIQSAFFLMSKRWHPDRLGAEPAEVRQSALRVFESISLAYRVLADPAQRVIYDAQRKAGEDPTSTPAVDRALSAELAFQKAESLLARGNLEAAAREAARALQFDAKRPEHVALNAWLAALQPQADYRRIAAELARALRDGPDSIKVHWYRALFLKRVGRHASALQEFRHVCEKDPRHIDAAREVRLYEQRLLHGPQALSRDSDAPPSSAWSRLFKRRS